MKKRFILAMFLVIGGIGLVSAGTSWTDAYTYTLDTDSWKSLTTAGVMMGQDKTTDANYYDVNVVSKSENAGEVRFRLVNSNNEPRSDVVVTPSVGLYKRGYGNVGQIGYAYFGSVLPTYSSSANIKLQMKDY